MITWTNLIETYADKQPFFSAFINSYKFHFNETDFGMFSEKNETKLLAEINKIVRDEAEEITTESFLYQFVAYLHTKAQDADSFAKYKQLFTPADQAYITDLESYFRDTQTGFDILRNLDFDNVRNNAERIANLTFPYTFWENFARSLKLRIEKLKENTSQINEQGELNAHFAVTEQAIAKNLVDGLYINDSLFTVYGLANLSIEDLAIRLKAIPYNNAGFISSAELVIANLHQVYNAQISNPEFKQAFLNLFSEELRSGMDELLESSKEIINAPSYRVLTEELTVNVLLNYMANLPADKAYFRSLASWLIETSKAYLLQVGKLPAPFTPTRKEVTGKLTSELTDKLANYLVKILDAEDGTLLDQAITQAFGLFKFSYLPAFTELGNGEVSYLDKNVKFEIFYPVTLEKAIEPVQKTIAAEQVEIEITTQLSDPVIPKIPASEIETLPGKENNETLNTFLRTLNLSNIREAGSFDKIDGTEAFREEEWYPELVKKLDAHAELNLFSHDLILNEKAISLGFDNTVKIVEASREEFVSKMVEETPDDDQLYISSATMHQQAATTEAFTQALNLLERSALASNYLAGSPAGTGNARVALTAENAKQKCTCDGCQTAVSPSAYLNALLDYTSKNVKKDAQTAVTTGILKTLFKQKFSELANYCQEATERYVCLIRVAIETIREYIGINNGIYNDISSAQKAPYLQAVYDTLLGSLGTNANELKQVITGLTNADKLVKTKSQDKLRKLSDRMGLSEQFIVNGLYLAPVPSGAIRELNEANLEILFGLQNTLRNPFSIGAKVEGNAALEYWEFRGMEWLKNTDENGYIYLRIASNWVEVYKSGATHPEEKNKVAKGKLNPDKTAVITPVNGSELYGELQFNEVPSGNYTLSLIPEVVAQQFLYKENEWKTESQTSENLALQTDFIIDPDLIGPDDIRNPEVAGTVGQAIYDIWEKRRVLLDTISIKLAEKIFEPRSPNNTPSEIEKTLNYIAGKRLSDLGITSYAANSGLMHWDITNNLLKFRDRINSTATTAAGLITDLYKKYQSDPANVNVLKLINNGAQDGPGNDGSEPGFGFTVESFVYLNELWVKSLTTNLSDEEKIEVVNILTQTFKASLKHIFLAEEATVKTSMAATLGVNPTTFSLLNPTVFYAPIHEPTVGEWKKLGNVVASKAVPYIDPENFSVKDLPDPAFGETAKNLLNRRKDELKDQFNAILGAKSGNTIEAQSDAMFAKAYSSSNPGFPTGYTSYSQVYEVLIQETHTDYAAIVNFITNVLKLTIEEFQRIFAIRQKNATEKDWETHAAILTTAWKRKVKYTTELTGWITKETHEYWRLYKHHLTKWRATEVQRNSWKEAIQALNQLPVIDPDQVADADFLHPEMNDKVPNYNPAYGVYNNRVTTLAAWQIEVKQSQTLAYKINRFVFGLPASGSANNDGLGELKTLHNLYLDNVDVTARLRQLNLNIPALDYLITHEAAYGQLADADPVKTEIENILLQCRKERYYSIWRAEENAAGIIVSDLYFKEPFAQATELNIYLDTILKPWRSNLRNRQNWQNLLSARIEQRKSLAAQAQQAVENAEDQHLITLRNALLLHSNITAASTFKTVEENAKWLSDKLLIDFSINCCQKTTRLAQAIEVLQKMYFLIRNGDNTFGSNTLTISNPNLEKDWQWLGSYESWRSLMFVYLYPENLLQPSFKPVQTEKFREIVQRTRENLRFTPTDACHLMHEYEEYMQEIASLQLKGSARAYVETARDGCATNPVLPEEVNFQVALSKNQKAYWNTYTKDTNQEGKVSTWKVIPNLEKVDRIVAATTYITPAQDRFLYVFAVVKKEKDKKAESKEKQSDKQLVAARYNLATASWEDSLLEFDLPDEIIYEELQLTENSNELEPPIISGLRDRTDSTWYEGSNSTIFYDKGPYKVKDTVGFEVCDYIMFSIKLSLDGNKMDMDNIMETKIRYTHKAKMVASVVTAAQNICYFILCQINKAAKTRLYYHYKTPSYPDITAVSTRYEEIDNDSNSKVNQHFYRATQNRHPDRMMRELGEYQVFIESFKFRGLILSSHKASNPVNVHYDDDFTLTYSTGQPGNLGLNLKFTRILQHIQNRFIERINVTPTNITLPAYLAYSEKANPCFQVLKAGTAVPGVISCQNEFGINVVNIVNNNVTRLLPDFRNASALLTKLDANSQSIRRQKVRNLITHHSSAPKEVQAYVEEAYFYLPLHLALELQKGKHYEEALKYFRLVYDYQLPVMNRKIYYGLTKEEQNSDLMGNALTWLNNPDNPHTIGALRSNSYTRFTLTSIARCIMEFADQEFTRDTAESVPRAKELYELAEELLAYEMKRFDFESCEALLKETDALVPDVRWKPEWERLKEMLREIGLKNEISKLLKDGFTDTAISKTYRAINTIFSDVSLSWEDKIEKAEEAIEARMQLLHTTSTQSTGSSGSIPYSHYDVMRTGLTHEAVEEAVMGMTNYTAERLNNAVGTVRGNTGSTDNTWLAETGMPPVAARQAQTDVEIDWNALLGMSGAVNRPYVPFLGASFCVPNNPVPHSLYLYVQLSLFKIRNCMNIAGMKRELDPYAAPTDATSGMPMIGANGRITYPGKMVVPATQYRYSVLVERTKQLVSIAQQVENALLSALEKRDGEYYSQLKARQDIQTGKATVKLQDLRIKEAQDGVELAKMQKERSQIMEKAYQEWINAGPNPWEMRMLEAYNAIAAANIISAYLQNTISVASASEFKTPIAAVAASFKNLSDVASISANYDVQVASFYASHARRVDEWTLQKNLATQDLKIGDQQIKLSEDRVRITGQEKVISALQLEHSEDTLNFLLTKFTSAELYDWMGRVLEGVYNYFLQQATVMAKLAEQQLAFERQESPAGYIQADYWAALADNLSYGAENTKQADRKGLTGSVRLLQDVTKLDQYAFDTNKRKLQLTKTLSLAQLFPVEFARFKQTGRLPFSTLQTWFDRDFPGQYLRIIRRIKTSVIALVPPTDGIKAKLETSGISRVVVNGQQPQTVIMPRPGESVSYTSPINATGLFELEQQPGEMLYPFEGMGVEANWEFIMEPGSNMLDFSTIADVLIAIDYTALESYDHARNVKAGLNLNNKVILERSFSFKNNFPDQWFDLNHASETADPFTITFELNRQDFPLNLKDVKITNLSLLIDTNEEKHRDGLEVNLYQGDPAAMKNSNVKAGTTNKFGLVSTKTGKSASSSSYNLYSGNGKAWSAFKDAPEGTWVLSLGDPKISNDKLRGLMQQGKINDLIFIVEFEGEGPTFLEIK